MIKHIVMWKINDENKKENAEKIKSMLEALKGKIPEIQNIEAGININTSEAAFDIVLVSEFDSNESLNKYQNHPEHLKVGEFIKSVALQRKVVDYIII